MMKVKLVNAATIVYNGKLIRKGEVFEMKDEDVKRYRDMVQVVKDQPVKTEDTKKKKSREGEGK